MGRSLLTRRRRFTISLTAGGLRPQLHLSQASCRIPAGCTSGHRRRSTGYCCGRGSAQTPGDLLRRMVEALFVWCSVFALLHFLQSMRTTWACPKIPRLLCKVCRLGVRLCFLGGPGRGGRYRHGGALGRSATLGVMVAAERSPDDLRFFERFARAEGPATLFKRPCGIGWTV